MMLGGTAPSLGQSRRAGIQPLIRSSANGRAHSTREQQSLPQNYVQILDTTLRDGEQSPGVCFSIQQKLDIAKRLARLRVDVIDAGFPATSPQESRAVELIARQVGSYKQGEDLHRGRDEEGQGEEQHVPVICGLARCVKSDIDAAWRAIRYAHKPRILAFISTSDIHMKHKLNKSPSQVLATAAEMVAYAKSLGCHDIQFGAEDSGRSDPEFLCEIFEAVIEAGATSVGIGDTVGYLFPSEIASLVNRVKQGTQGIEGVTISCHCHNDLGLATSNTLAAALAGARQLEVSMNGIGERAGNASLEEVVMAMKCRSRDPLLQGLYTGIETKHIYPTSQAVEDYTGMLVQPNKAIVGANAFVHESGVHQDGILKNRATYEILSPSDIGLVQTHAEHIVLGKHSGKHALSARLTKLGYNLDTEALGEVFMRFKAVAHEKKIVTDTDLTALVVGEKL
ncbi:hypothetical protein SELMODRAFT_173046 [Selaginella moellendorffii]|uniref:2-isopropylmalate synthase n=1 Tax=Selaginella moellendorffii TaxID=88036 RepID=D8RNW1_SELML|nr:2-isopropylmalate synthase A [Selaginella moellendorffii]EFJ26149.1 hypothetical protein SELMODRAFT_173046 [Selaginella moellendorffii]|eukprot:XP_002972928.1 2-isopropylmalate synthase A [Selaginella moellendorffii]